MPVTVLEKFESRQSSLGVDVPLELFWL